MRKYFGKIPSKKDVSTESIGFCDECTERLKKMVYTHQVMWNVHILRSNEFYEFNDTCEYVNHKYNNF